MSFSDKDISLIQEKGISPEKVKQQLEIFKRGNVFVNIREAATVKNGILAIAEEDREELIRHFDSRRDQLDILKFVPASGAATRMFKAFYNFLKEFDPQKEDSLEDYIDRKNDRSLEIFFARLKDLPFYEEVVKRISSSEANFDELPEDRKSYLFVKYMLQEDGLNLGNQPKGLVPFHKYEHHLATAFEEHLIEAVDYAAAGKKVRLHFTVAKEHREKFEQEAQRVIPRLEKEIGHKFEVTYSYQDPKTDTVAVTKENEPFRDEKGEIFFRPGGHGALIENLNDQKADLIFIKNIDNVVIPKNRRLLSTYKKMLAGKLLQLQEKTFGYLEILDSAGEEKLQEMGKFLQQELKAGLEINFEELQKGEKTSVLMELLNRPLRVCGMVKNEGEPGGGPFWVTHKNGEISLQIVESSQIDHDNYQQSKIAQEATHFNPVDVVCATKDYRGNKFNLQKFVDPETSFIANKTKDGKELKALELPGLWNGGMAHWNTIFVEVPVETFNPVKTVSDLLKPSHQVR